MYHPTKPWLDLKYHQENLYLETKECKNKGSKGQKIQKNERTKETKNARPRKLGSEENEKRMRESNLSPPPPSLDKKLPWYFTEVHAGDHRDLLPGMSSIANHMFAQPQFYDWWAFQNRAGRHLQVFVVQLNHLNRHRIIWNKTH